MKISIYNKIATLLLVTVVCSKTFGQAYWTESFESTNIPGNSSSQITTPVNVDLSATSGIWNMSYVYRGSTGCTSGKPLRLLKTSTAAGGFSFAISPAFNHGISTLQFIETTGGTSKEITIEKSRDNGTTWILVDSIQISANACDTFKLDVYDTLANKLRFSNHTNSDINMDLLTVYKYGGTIILPPPPPTDTIPYYPFDSTRLLAFPGADGAGAYTRGGRGGAVYEVTNLLDDAAGNTLGSFRYIQKINSGPKTIVFRVSGTIHLVAPLSLQRSDMTIAGQTAPGGGICFADAPVTFGKSNVILRFIRFRLGDIALQRNPPPYASSAADCYNSSGGANADSMIVDHCSSSWSDDESCTFKNMTHFTLQNCIISEPLNQSQHAGELHGYGGIWGGVNATFHHNLFAHCSNRSPRFNGSRQYSGGTLDTVDLRNNVIYDWGINTVYGGEGGYYNVVNNYYKPGPSTSAASYTRTLNPYSGSGYGFGKYYMTGNKMTSSVTVTANNWSSVVMEGATLADTAQSKVNSQIKTYRVKFTSADSAYQSILKNAGAYLPVRDTVDQRIIRNVIDSTGRIIDVQGGYPPNTDSTISYTAWPTLFSAPAPIDGDHDGMPNEWEWQRGLDSTNANDRNFISPNRYTNLENYLNGDTLTAPGVLNTCVSTKAFVTTGTTGNFIFINDTSYSGYFSPRYLVSTDSNNVVAAIKDVANFGSFSASYFTTSTIRYTNASLPYLNRNITIVPSNPSLITSPVTVRLYISKKEYDALKAVDASITSLADLRILKYTGSSCLSAIPAGLPDAAITPTATGVFGTYQNGYYLEFQTASFSTFFVTGPAYGGLPLSLLSFTGSLVNKKAALVWETTNEVNTKYFSIEKSLDGVSFATIGQVDAKGSNAKNNYTFNDVNILTDKAFYRLKMMDKDAKFTYSPTIKLSISGKIPFSIFPNPVSNNMSVTYPVAGSGALVNIYSIDGKKIASYLLPTGSTATTINISSLSKGAYQLQYQNGSETKSLNFIKQ